MGGACLLMAAHRDPGLFDLLVVFEPIVFPPARSIRTTGHENDGTMLSSVPASAARPFDSFDAAIANYSSKPPMKAFDPDVRPARTCPRVPPVTRGGAPEVRPEHEARTFDTGGGPHHLGDPAGDRRHR